MSDEQKVVIVLYPDGTIMPQGYCEGIKIKKDRHMKGSRFFLVSIDIPLYSIMDWILANHDTPEFKEV